MNVGLFDPAGFGMGIDGNDAKVGTTGFDYSLIEVPVTIPNRSA